MGKAKTYVFVSFLVTVLMLGSCTKIEKTTRKFIKEGRWMFTELTINGQTIDNLATWDVYACEDEVEFCDGIWSHSNGSTAQFLWRFSEFSGDLEFYLNPVEKFDKNKASLQCNNLTGEYVVVSSTSDIFEFECYETNGFPGTRVYIKMEVQ